jgi:hypothetical protein
MNGNDKPFDTQSLENFRPLTKEQILTQASLESKTGSGSMMDDTDTMSMQGDSTINSTSDTTKSGKTNSSEQLETVLISAQPILNRILEAPTMIRTFTPLENHGQECS